MNADARKVGEVVDGDDEEFADEVEEDDYDGDQVDRLTTS